jgi:hypothetical protein
MSGTRPWFKNDNHPYRDEFLKYRAMTKWGNSPLWNDATPVAKKAMTNVCKALPKPITFAGIRVVHAGIYPFYRNVKHNLTEKS